MHDIIGSYDESVTFENDSIFEMRVKAGDIAMFWTKCGLIANFGSSYLSLNYPNFKNISNSISFIVNELLENAVKYSYSEEDTIDIRINGKNSQIIVDVMNTIDSNQYAIFSPILREIQDTDHANAKYIERFRTMAENQSDSGIGLLSIINFFKSRITAKFSDGKTGALYTVFVQAAINIEDL
jgi:hypothetical protein